MYKKCTDKWIFKNTLLTGIQIQAQKLHSPPENPSHSPPVACPHPQQGAVSWRLTPQVSCTWFSMYTYPASSTQYPVHELHPLLLVAVLCSVLLLWSIPLSIPVIFIRRPVGSFLVSYIHVSVGWTPRSGIARSWVCQDLDLVNSPKQFSRVVVPTDSAPTVYDHSIWSTSSPTL